MRIKFLLLRVLAGDREEEVDNVAAADGCWLWYLHRVSRTGLTTRAITILH